MERLTTNKSVADMSMIELAHNSCYADDERNARYRDYDMEMDARDFTRNLMATLTKDELPVDDAEFDEEILDNLTIDPFSDVRGLIALFHRNMWAMADLREKLKDYEDAEEQGLGNVGVRAEIERLKEIKRQQIVAGADDFVEIQMRIAFSDMGDYLSFGRETVRIMGAFGPIKDPETGEYLTKEVNTVHLAESCNVDTQIIQEVKQGKDGVSLKLADKQKAYDWLTKYFLLHPDDKYKAEFDKKRAEVSDNSGAQILQNMQTIADILQHPVANRSISDLEEGDADE